MRFPSLSSVSRAPALHLAAAAAALALVLGTGCGRTDLEESLLAYADAGLPDTSIDSSLPDAVGRDVATDSVVPFDVTNPPDVIPPIDAPVDVGVDSSTCGNGTCDGGETCTSCPLDCGFCPRCGDGTCDPTESCSSCPQDCGSCQTCGNGFCDNGENCLSCPGDCGVCPSCGDGRCNGTENCTNCPADCGQCVGCGDGHCSQNETCVSCPADCGSCAFCGNGKCEASAGETCNTCAQDCGTCPIATTCSQILTCAIKCFQGGIATLSLSCIADCDANACTQAQGFANQATDCIAQAFLSGQCGTGGGGGGGALQCAQQACASQIAACLGSSPCPGTGG
jgi:hypothetical protein